MYNERALLQLAITGQQALFDLTYQQTPQQISQQPNYQVLLIRCLLAMNRTDEAIPLLQKALANRNPYAAALALALGDHRNQWFSMRPNSAQLRCDQLWMLLRSGYFSEAKLQATQLGKHSIEQRWCQLLDFCTGIGDWQRPTKNLLAQKQRLLPHWSLGWLPPIWWEKDSWKSQSNYPQQIKVLEAIGANLRKWAEQEWRENSTNTKLGLILAIYALQNPSCIDLGLSISCCLQQRLKQHFPLAIWTRLQAEKQNREQVRYEAKKLIQQKGLDPLSFLLIIDSLRICSDHSLAKSYTLQAFKQESLSRTALRLLNQWDKYQGAQYILFMKQLQIFEKDTT